MTPENGEPILVVEDDLNDVALLERAFRKARLVNPIHVVHRGGDAEAYLKGESEHGDVGPPALILLDLKLPGRSGHEVLRWIRTQPELTQVPVVVLTSSREDADIERAYALGANSYLQKPASFEALLEMVDTLNLYWMVMNVRGTRND